MDVVVGWLVWWVRLKVLRPLLDWCWMSLSDWLRYYSDDDDVESWFWMSSRLFKYRTANWWFEDGHQLNRISIKPCMSITWVYITSPSLLLSLSLCLSIIKLDLTLTSTSTLDLIMSERTRIVIRHLPAALPEDVFWKTLSPWIEPNHHHNHSNQPIIIYKSYIPGKTRHRLVFIIFIFSSQLLTVFFFFFHQ